MGNKTIIPSLRYLSAIFIAVSICMFACENKIPTVNKSELMSLPSHSGRNIRTLYTDSGRLILVLITPLIERYEKADPPYAEFREGIKVLFHDGNTEPVGSVTAKYAKYTDSKSLWELKDSVVAVNEMNDKLETELLYWDEKKDLIYTDRFVKITNEDQIVMGTGFESDPRLQKRKIRNVSATIYLTDEQ